MRMNNPDEYEQSDLYKMRHTAAHIMAQAVLELYPTAKLGIGPPIEDGFYYDFDLGRDDQGRPLTFTPEDLPHIEQRMRQIIAGAFPLEYREIKPQDAEQLFAGQPYKQELITELVTAGEPLSTYRQDGFEDLCRGPHVAHTGQVPAVGLKLRNVAGAYWRGDESRPMLQRIYGTLWPNRKALKAYLQRQEEARQRDHRKLGRDLELFMFHEEVGPGLALWLPRGEIILQELEKLAKEMETAAGYQRVRTPHLAKEQMYLRSRHLPYYEAEMFPPMEREGARYYLKPMNCPFHHYMFAHKPRSYRDLPLRLTEYGMVYRYEASGQLFGLMRVRGAQQNDAHIYCSVDQFEAEFLGVMDLYKAYFQLFGIEKVEMRLSKHSPAKLGQKYVNDPAGWLRAEEMVRRAMLKSGIPFVEAEDEAAFYGPKIDVQVWSAIGKEFSLATNQLDFAAAPRFNLTFTNADGEPEAPLCIHRAPLGSHERLVGFLIEHYAGNFPVWLSPEQVRVIPITDNHHAYAQSLVAHMQAAGIRAAADLGNERMQAKIRQAQLLKIPYMLVVGDREVEQGTVAVRHRDGQRENGVSFAAFVDRITEQIVGRSVYITFPGRV
jgi:threonyl-tRNA synthetase